MSLDEFTAWEDSQDQRDGFMRKNALNVANLDV